MILKHLKLKNAIGLKLGSGITDLDLDFEQLTGIVAIVGPNGSGKTTLLENLHPYLNIPGQDKAVADCFDGDGERALDFEYDGKVVKATIKLQKNKVSAFLVVNGVELNPSGNQRSYTAELEKLLGPASLFFQTAFCSQRAFRLVGLRRGKRQELFYRLNRLEHYIAKNDKAKQQVTALAAELGKDKQEIDLLYAKFGFDGKTSVDIRLAEKLTELNKAETDLKLKVVATTAKIQKLDETIKLMQAAKTWAEQRDALDTKLQTLSADLKPIDEDAQDKLDKAHTELKDILNEQRAVERVVAATTDELATYEKNIAEVEQEDQQLAYHHSQLAKLRRDLDSFGAAKDIGDLQSKIDKAEKFVKQDHELRAELTTNDTARGAAKGKEISADALVKIYKKQLEELRATKGPAELKLLEAKEFEKTLAEEIPCADISLQNPLYSYCPAYSVAAKLKVTPEMEAEAKEEITARQTETIRIEALLETQEAVLAETRLLLVTLENRQKDINKALTELNKDVYWPTEFVKLTAARNDIQARQEEYLRIKYSIADIEAKLANIDRSTGKSTVLAKLARRRDAVVAEKDKHKDILKSLMDQAAEAELPIIALTKEIEANTQQLTIRKELENLKGLIATHEQTKPDWTETAGIAKVIAEKEQEESYMSTLHNELGSINYQAQSVMAALEEIHKHPLIQPERITERKQKQKDLDEWTVVEQATRPSQMPLAELETISSNIELWANRLLEGLNPDGISIQLETRRATEDGKETDTLDFRIMRPDLPGCLIEDLSDSQKAWVEEAIIEAALISHGVGTRQWLTSFTDETGATMSPDNAQAFLDFKQRAMELSDRKCRLMVIQNPAIYSQVEHRIVVDPVTHSIYIEG